MKTGFNLLTTQQLMEKDGLDCVVATSHDNVFYCSGADIWTITMLKRLAAVFISLDDEPVLGVHAIEEAIARQSTWIKDVRIYEGGEWEPLKPIRFVADVLKEKGLSSARIGLELLDMPGLCFNYLRELLPSAKFVDCQYIFDKIRSVKSPDELKLLSDANMLTAKTITVAFEMARPGDAERDIAQNMINLALEYGANKVSFMTLAAGKNIFEIHHVPSDYSIKKGDMLHVDFGCFFQGYLSDIARMAVVGEPDKVQLKAYDIAVRAEYATADAMRSGVKVIEVHNAVKNFYEAEGLNYTRGFIGHGSGIGCHESPFLGPSHGDWVLEPRMFFQIEPRATIGHVSAHTEDAFIVTINGVKNVSNYKDTTQLQIIK